MAVFGPDMQARFVPPAERRMWILLGIEGLGGQGTGDPNGEEAGLLAAMKEHMGGTFWSEGNSSKAEEWWLSALEDAHRLGNLESVSNLLGNIGMARYRRRDMNKARSFLRDSLALGLRLGNTRAIANALGALANIERDCGSPTTAARLYSLQSAWADVAKSPTTAVMAILNEGAELLEAGDTGRAETLFRAALARSRELHDILLEARAILSLSQLFNQLGRREAAAETAEEACARAEIGGDDALTRLCCNTAGRYHALQGNTGRAVPRLERALLLARKLEDTAAEGLALQLLAVCHKNTGRYSAAMRCASAAIDIAHGLKNVSLLLSAHLARANVFLRTGRFRDGLAELSLARRVTRGREHSSQLGDVYYTCGALLDESGYQIRALRAFRIARRRYEVAGMTSRAHTMSMHIEDLSIVVSQTN